VYVETHVHDRLRVEREQLPRERLVAALTVLVDDERGALKICAASPVRKETLYASPSSSMLCVAGRFKSAESPTPVTLEK
jgi:hypothetical protein